MLIKLSLPNFLQESYKKSSVEETPKPKRSRKKNKMPILSRYGKRSKKRRRSSNSTSSVIPSTSVRPPMASQSSLSSPQPSPTTPQTSPHFSAASCTGEPNLKVSVWRSPKGPEDSPENYATCESLPLAHEGIFSVSLFYCLVFFLSRFLIFPFILLASFLSFLLSFSFFHSC